MNEAQRMHDDLLHALLPIIPRTVYQDVRRRLSHIMVYVDGKFKLANVGCPNRLTSS